MNSKISTQLTHTKCNEKKEVKKKISLIPFHAGSRFHLSMWQKTESARAGACSVPSYAHPSLPPHPLPRKMCWGRNLFSGLSGLPYKKNGCGKRWMHPTCSLWKDGRKKITPRECSTDATVRSRVQGLRVGPQRWRKLIFPSITNEELKKDLILYSPVVL